MTCQDCKYFHIWDDCTMTCDFWKDYQDPDDEICSDYEDKND
jgi:hypothetical protein